MIYCDIHQGWLIDGTVCGLDDMGHILCPVCGSPIKSQIEMEENSREAILE